MTSLASPNTWRMTVTAMKECSGLSSTRNTRTPNSGGACSLVSISIQPRTQHYTLIVTEVTRFDAPLTRTGSALKIRNTIAVPKLRYYSLLLDAAKFIFTNCSRVRWRNGPDEKDSKIWSLLAFG